MAIKMTHSREAPLAEKVLTGKEAERTRAFTQSLETARAAYEAHTLAQLLYGHIASAQMWTAVMPMAHEAAPMPVWNTMWSAMPFVSPAAPIVPLGF